MNWRLKWRGPRVFEENPESPGMGGLSALSRSRQCILTRPRKGNSATTELGMPFAAETPDTQIFVGCLSNVQPCRVSPVRGNHAEAVASFRLIVATPFRALNFD